MPQDTDGGTAVVDKPQGGADGAAGGAGKVDAGAGTGAGPAADAGGAGVAGGGAKPAVDPKADAGKPAGDKPDATSLLGGAKDPKAKPEDKAGDKPDAKSETKTDVKTGAPEKGYADFKLPEGLNANKELMEGFKAIAKDMGLSQDSAQKFVDFQANSVLAEAKANQEAVVKQKAAWAAETKTKLGADWDKELGFAARAMDKFGGEKYRETLDELGIGDHPALVQPWIRIGKAMAEDKPLEGDRSGIVDPLEATKRALFPTMYPKPA